jgi:hypothetical protein
MLSFSSFKSQLRTIAAIACVSVVAGCGGGSVDVVVGSSPPPIAGLAIVLTRVGPEAIQIDWSDDPLADTFTVRRDGFALARVNSTTLIDASVIVNRSYCYQVSGFDRSGLLVSASDTACVTVFP